MLGSFQHVGRYFLVNPLNLPANNYTIIGISPLYIQVNIQAELEKKIIKLINDFREENGDKGPISGRLTSKKLLVKMQFSSDLWSTLCDKTEYLRCHSLCLQDLYTALEKFKFKREHIEEAMKSSVLYGGDLHSALDWLCLNLKDGDKALSPL